MLKSLSFFALFVFFTASSQPAFAQTKAPREVLSIEKMLMGFSKGELNEVLPSVIDKRREENRIAEFEGKSDGEVNYLTTPTLVNGGIEARAARAELELERRKSVRNPTPKTSILAKENFELRSDDYRYEFINSDDVVQLESRIRSSEMDKKPDWMRGYTVSHFNYAKKKIKRERLELLRLLLSKLSIRTLQNIDRL